ncbi:hypothetical protein DRH14_02585 [Candidatus Shapirobacteria bacterium]|nr:MAG: hypothetical protein DRH14_02585 [Candidatus Shapirobacteria bacterium]
MKKVDQRSAAVILVDKNRVLLQLRDNIPNIVYPGYWSIPGGKIEDSENAKDASKRELKEETGYVADKVVLLKKEIYSLDDGRIIERNIFWTKYDGQQKIECFEGQKMKFKNLDEMGRMKLYPGHLKFIKEAIKLAQK